MTDIKWTAASAVVLYFCECKVEGDAVLVGTEI
jgi:hypothetical protein